MPPNRRPPRVGLLLPEFPTQTHIAWWRVGNAMRELGAELQVLSTRRPPKDRGNPHPQLDAEAENTFYAWPPRPLAVLATCLTHPLGVLRAFGYLFGLKESNLREKARLLPILVAAAGLAHFARQRELELIHVHSCADAAHLIAMARLMGGAAYSLRLGGDLEVYGKDHASKMRDAVLIVPGARAYVQRIVEEVGIPESRIHWTWVGVDTRTFTPGERVGRAPGEAFQVVTVARLNLTKGHVDVLDALAEIRKQGVEFRYTLVGTGPFEAEIRQHAAKLGIEDCLDWQGSLSQEAIRDTLRASDVFILGSYGLGESTPAVVSEAMACGVPIVCTKIGGTTDMLVDGSEGYLVEQHDSAAMARALSKLATDEAHRREMSAAALKGAQRFDVRTVARGVLEKAGVVLPPAS